MVFNKTLNQHFKCVQRLKENVSKELKENISIVSWQIKTINKDKMYIKKNSSQLEIMELKMNTKIKIKILS